jgi:hypothetical protein
MNEQVKKAIRKTNPLIIAFKNIKYLGINLVRELRDLYHKIYKSWKEVIEDDIRRWRTFHGQGSAESIL